MPKGAALFLLIFGVMILLMDWQKKTGRFNRPVFLVNSRALLALSL